MAPALTTGPPAGPVPADAGNSLWGEGWRAVRDLWDLDPAITHLNHASFGAVPRPVADVQANWRSQAEANPDRFFARLLPGLLASVRERVAAFVGADPDRCVLVPNVTAAVATVLASTELRAGDEVLLTTDTYPGVRAAVEAACRRAGALPVVARPADNRPEAMVEAVLGACGPRTRIAFVDHVTSPTAILVPVARLAAELRDRGAVVVVDGAHAPGALALDVEAVGADFYAGNLHKWCCAPRGAGFLAVSPRARPGLVAGVVGSRADAGFPAGLEWWGTADYSALLAVPAAFDLLEDLGLERVRDHNARLVAAGARRVAVALGVVIATPAPLPMASIPLGPMTRSAAEQMRLLLAERGIETMVVSAREHGHLRLSAHVHNRPADFERLADELPQVIAATTRR